MNKTYTVTVNKLPESQVELKASIPWETVATFEETAFTKLAEKIKLDGFREGKVPTDVARKHIPDEILIADMAELAIQNIYPLIVTEQQLDVIGRPDVSITKIARDNALEFTVTAAVVPPIELPDYKKVAKGIALVDAKEVTDADIDKVIEDLRQVRAYGHVHGEHDAHQHEEPLPEVNDEFAKSFGNFNTVAELRDKVRENLINESAHTAHDKRRIAIMEAIIEKTSFDLPAIILDSEKQKMLAQIEADVARSGATLDDYLTHIQKTKDQLLEEFKPEADKRARFQLVLNAIARKEKTLPTEEEVEAEAQKLMQMYPGADLNRTKAYADMMLTNEKVFVLLEEK